MFFDDFHGFWLFWWRCYKETHEVFIKAHKNAQKFVLNVLKTKKSDKIAAR